MAEPKTRMTEASVTKFIETIEDEQKRDDCFAIIKMMTNSSEAEPKMWGTQLLDSASMNFDTQLAKHSIGL